MSIKLSLFPPMACAYRTQSPDAAAHTDMQAGRATRSGKPVVELSRAARCLASGQPASNDIDQAKVLALREALACGQFSMDSPRIADGLLATACDLLT